MPAASPRHLNWLNGIEPAANRLPDPVILFLWLCGLAVAGPVVANRAGPRGICPARVKALLDLFIGSTSAKRTLMATMFVPMMFMRVCIPPPRGDQHHHARPASPIRCLAVGAPSMPGFGFGALIATMLPYSVGFFGGSTALLLARIRLPLPLGPGMDTRLP